MIQIYQQIVDDTVKFYNTVTPKTFKQIVKSKRYKQLIRPLNDKQYIISMMILQRIATARQPVTTKIKLRHIPTQGDLNYFNDYMNEEFQTQNRG